MGCSLAVVFGGLVGLILAILYFVGGFIAWAFFGYSDYTWRILLTENILQIGAFVVPIAIAGFFLLFGIVSAKRGM